MSAFVSCEGGGGDSDWLKKGAYLEVKSSTLMTAPECVQLRDALLPAINRGRHRKRSKPERGSSLEEGRTPQAVVAGWESGESRGALTVVGNVFSLVASGIGSAFAGDLPTGSPLASPLVIVGSVVFFGLIVFTLIRGLHWLYPAVEVADNLRARQLKQGALKGGIGVVAAVLGLVRVLASRA